MRAAVTTPNASPQTPAHTGFTAASAPVVDRYYKVVLVGNSGVGKTSLCNALDGRPGETTLATIGTDHMSKVYRVEGQTVVLQLWDTAGAERFAKLTHTYFRNARAILLAYAVNDRESFSALSDRWRRELYYAIGPCTTGDTRVFLLANKVDLPETEWVVTREEALVLCAPYGWQLYESSAMEQQRTERLFADIVQALVREDGRAKGAGSFDMSARGTSAGFVLHTTKSPAPQMRPTLEGARPITGTVVTASHNGPERAGCGC